MLNGQADFNARVTRRPLGLPVFYMEIAQQDNQDWVDSWPDTDKCVEFWDLKYQRFLGFQQDTVIANVVLDAVKQDLHITDFGPRSFSDQDLNICPNHLNI